MSDFYFYPSQTPPEQIERLLNAVADLLDALEPCSGPARIDPQHGQAIRELGDRIGYGALMSGASAEWREYLGRRGLPSGAEYVAGPCYLVLKAAFDRTTKAFEPFKPPPDAEDDLEE